MKVTNRILVALMAGIFSITMMVACGSDGTSTSDPKPDSTGTDTSILDNANTSYPNDRIHITDSNKTKDSSGRDSIKK